MTLPTIARTLEKLRLQPQDIPEDQAKSIVFTAIETDLADGVRYLETFQSINWNVIEDGQEELCSHCALKDINTRRQVIRLSAYSPLRQYVHSALGLNVGMHVFSATSDDAGPSSRLIVAPAGHKLKTSPERTLQVMQWGPTAEPPPAKSRQEAIEILWAHAQLNLAAGLNHLRQSMAPEHAQTGLPGNGALIPELLELIGVDGMHAVVQQKLGTSFYLHNCHAPQVKEGPQPTTPEGKTPPQPKDIPEESTDLPFSGVSFRPQLLHQSHEVLMHC